MPTPLPGPIPTSVDTVEKLVIYSLDMYRRAAAGQYYSERSDADKRPFLQSSIDQTYSEENGSSLFIIFRGAVPLNPDYALQGETLWEGAFGLAGQTSLPAGFV